MAHLKVLDGVGATVYIRVASGTGTEADPYLLERVDSNSAAQLAAAQAIRAAVEILDNVVSGSEAQVDVLTAPADPFGANADAAVVAGAAGSIQAKLRLMTTQLDAIQTAVQLLDNAIAGTEMQVDLAGGTLPDTATGDVAAIRAALAAVQTAVETLDNAIAGTEMQVDVVTLPGTVATDIAAIKTAVEILDNAISGSEGQVDVVTLPSANLGQQAMAASLSIVPASNVTDGTYVGDIRFGEAFPAGSAHIGAVGGHTAKPSATVTRPADTTAYVAGDVVNAATGAVITFSGCARANGLGGVIQHAKLVDSANQATKGSFELWLFDTTFTPDNDNAVFTPTDAEMATVVCVINLSSSTFVGDATAGDGGNVLHQSDVLNRAFTCETADTALYGALVVRNAYTPVSGETFAIQLEILQD